MVDALDLRIAVNAVGEIVGKDGERKIGSRLDSGRSHWELSLDHMKTKNEIRRAGHCIFLIFWYQRFLENNLRLINSAEEKVLDFPQPISERRLNPSRQKVGKNGDQKKDTRQP